MLHQGSSSFGGNRGDQEQQQHLAGLVCAGRGDGFSVVGTVAAGAGRAMELPCLPALLVKELLFLAV